MGYTDSQSLLIWEHDFESNALCRTDLPATIPFLLKSSRLLSAKNTSASSSSRMQPHLLASAKLVCKAASTSLGFDPRSPGLQLS